MTVKLDTVTLVSLEPWDRVWRRNQHLAYRLVERGHVREVRFISPPLKLRRVASAQPSPGISVLTPTLLVPRKRGGLRLVAESLKRRPAIRSDVLWVNDPRLGVRLLRRAQPAVYDVTDDWREAQMPSADREDLVAAEDELAQRATTIVCSEVLRDRWQERYGVTPAVVHNAVDVKAHQAARRFTLSGQGPHAMYVGTLHDERLDIDLVLAVAGRQEIGQLHLVGPDSLTPGSRARLERNTKVWLHGPIASQDVPSWMASADVLLCPHLVNKFTLSLDAIKSFEYLASGKPVVATPSSGFQALVVGPGLDVAFSSAFPDAVVSALMGSTAFAPPAGLDWDERADAFGEILRSAARA